MICFMNIDDSILTKRHYRIIQMLKNNISMKVDELCSELSVSAITIRRDLHILENHGFVTRFHGGATLSDNFSELSLASNNDFVNEINLKHTLAKHAAQLIDDNDTIFINSSSTAILILEYIKNKRVTVITNNGDALNMNIDPCVQLIFTGGAICPGKNSMVGDFACHIFTQVTADKCFLGVSGISSSFGLGTSIFQETSINKMMLSRCSGDKIVITESHKIGKKSNFLTSDISSISCLITDSNCDVYEESLLNQKGIDVIKVDA